MLVPRRLLMLLRPRQLPQAIFVLGAVVAMAIVFFGSTGCDGGGGVLRAHVEAPPVEVRASDGMRELAFDVEARVSRTLAAGEVQVEVTGAGADVGGQVRVTVVRGGDSQDPEPSAAVVPCAADDDVALAHDALAGCVGNCTQSFTALFASEGLPDDGAVALPVSLSAELVYEDVADAPADDFLRLTLR